MHICAHWPRHAHAHVAPLSLQAKVNATKAAAQDVADALKKVEAEARTAREKVKEAKANDETARVGEKAAEDDLTDKNEAAKLCRAAKAAAIKAAAMVALKGAAAVVAAPMALKAVAAAEMSVTSKAVEEAVAAANNKATEAKMAADAASLAAESARKASWEAAVTIQFAQKQADSFGPRITNLRTEEQVAKRKADQAMKARQSANVLAAAKAATTDRPRVAQIVKFQIQFASSGLPHASIVLLPTDRMVVKAAKASAKAHAAAVEQAATAKKAVKEEEEGAAKSAREAAKATKAAAEAEEAAEAATAMVQRAKAVAAEAADEAAADAADAADAEAKVLADAATKSTYAEAHINNPATHFIATWKAAMVAATKAAASIEAAAKAAAAVPTHAQALKVAHWEAAKAAKAAKEVAEWKAKNEAKAEAKKAAKKAEAKAKKASKHLAAVTWCGTWGAMRDTTAAIRDLLAIAPGEVGRWMFSPFQVDVLGIKAATKLRAASIKRAELACRGETWVSADGKAEAEATRKVAFREKKAAKKARNADVAAARDAEMAAALANAQATAKVQAAHTAFEKAERKAEDARRRVEKCGCRYIKDEHLGLGLSTQYAPAAHKVWTRIVMEQKVVNCRAAKEAVALEENTVEMVAAADGWAVAEFSMTFQYSCGLTGRIGSYVGAATSTVGGLKRGLPPGFRVLDLWASGQAKQLDDEALLAKATRLFVMPPLEGAAPKRRGWGPGRENPKRMSTGTPTGDTPGDGSAPDGVEGKRIKLEPAAVPATPPAAAPAAPPAAPPAMPPAAPAAPPPAAPAVPPTNQQGQSDEQQPRVGSRTVYNRPLTAAEEAIADEYLVDVLHDPDEVINDIVNFAPVSRCKIRCLEPTEWLNDEVVNFFMGLLKARGDAATEADALPRCHFYNSNFYAKLYEKCMYEYAKVKRWTKSFDVFAKDLLLFPIHCHGNHWTLAVVNFRDKRFEYFDSISHEDEETGEYWPSDDGGVLANLRRYIKDEHLTKKKASWDDTSWTDHVWTAGVHTPLQKNGWDCGVFMCKTADHYAQDAGLGFREANMGYFRRRMAIEIHNKELFSQLENGAEEPQLLQLSLEGMIPVEGDPPTKWDKATFHCSPGEPLKPFILQILEAWAVDLKDCQFMFDNNQILELEGATPAHPNTGVDEAMENDDVIDLIFAPTQHGQPTSGGKASRKAGGKASRKASPLTAICVGDLATTYAKLLELSPGYAQPITLLVTHVEQPNLALRAFGNLGDISSPSAFARQGTMDEGNQGHSCGVEAAFNSGFDVRAADFDHSNVAGVDANLFRARERGQEADAGDDYMDGSGGGNNIPPNQMYATLQGRFDFPLEKNFHLQVQQLNTAAFWAGRMWAVILIPAAGGHWVSMEKIIYDGREAFCLREGRGTVMYDFVKFPIGGNPQRLTVTQGCFNPQRLTVTPPVSSPVLLSPPVMLNLGPRMAAVTGDATPPVASPLAEQAHAASSGAASWTEGNQAERGGSSGNVDEDGNGGSVSSGNGSDDDDDFQKSGVGAKPKAGKNVVRNMKRAERVAGAKALEPGSGSDVTYKIPPTQAEALSIEFVEGVTSFNTMAEVQANISAVAELHNRKVVSSGRLVEVKVEQDQAKDRASEAWSDEEEASGSEDDAVQLVYVPKNPKASQEAVPRGARTHATGANNKGVEYTALCPRACGGLTQFTCRKACGSYVCKKHRPCKCPPSAGKAAAQREATHAFSAASLAPVILEQVCRQKEGVHSHRATHTHGTDRKREYTPIATHTHGTRDNGWVSFIFSETPLVACGR